LRGGGVVIHSAADEFVPAILFSDKAGGPEGGNELTPCALKRLKLEI